MSARKPFTWEGVLYLLAVGLALVVRLRGLGHTPLSDAEAALALRAWQIAQGQMAPVGAQPGYVLPTAFLFFLSGTSDALARLWPALSGALLVALPYFWRDRLGRLPALLLAFGLALDPGLVATSRLADGVMPALAFTLAALTAWTRGASAMVGAFALLAWMSGPSAWLGTLVLALTWGVVVFFRRDLVLTLPRLRWRPAALAVLIFPGTLFFRAPQGVSGLGEALVAFLAGWRPPAHVSLAWMAAALTDEVLPLLFALIGAWQVWVWSNKERSALARLTTLWAGIGLLVVLAYPAARVADLVWFLLPLWVLAAYGLSVVWRRSEYLQVTGGMAALTVALLVFAWLDLAAVSLAPTGQELWLRAGVLSALIILLTLITGLVGAGWSRPAARSGLLLGMAFALGLLSLRGALRPEPSPWQPAQVGQVRLLVDTLGDLSEMRTGRRDALHVLVQGTDSPALAWALRRFSWEEVAGFGPSEMPEVVLRPASLGDLSRPAAYRGQGFAWSPTLQWDGRLGSALAWVTRRELPLQSDTLVLWARGDLFPGGSLAVQSGETAPLEEPLDVPAR